MRRHLTINIAVVLMLLAGTAAAQGEKDTAKGIIGEVKKFSEKDNFFSKLLRNIFVTDDTDEQERNQDIYRQFSPYSGRIIRNVEITVLDVFGPTIRRPEEHARSWLQKTGNSLHVNTREWVVRERLFFKPGQKLNPYDLAESERLLRENGYLYDARIVPAGVPHSSDSVDVHVFVQDVWSISGDAAYSSQANTGMLKLKDINFMGLGGELFGALKYDRSGSRKYLWDGGITANNYGRYYLGGSVYHFAADTHRVYGARINRDFYSPVVRYAGGISVEAEQMKIRQNPASAPVDYFRLVRYDFWTGYAFDFKPFNINAVNQNRLNFAVRLLRTNYEFISSMDTAGIFETNDFYLFRLGYAQRKYIKGSHIFGLGRTEDIPIGGTVELLYGFSRGRRDNPDYFGMRLGRAMFGSKGYLFGGLQAGGYHNGYGFRNAALSAEMFYFTPLLPALGAEWRNYIWLRYGYLYDPMHEALALDINNDRGIRGYSAARTGIRRLTLNFENNIFLPINIMGFKTALITFADYAFISGGGEKLLNTRLLQGYGIGLRIRNEHLVFPIIRLMIAFYPADDRFRLFTLKNVYYRMNNFQFSRPETVSFY